MLTICYQHYQQNNICFYHCFQLYKNVFFNFHFYFAIYTWRIHLFNTFKLKIFLFKLRKINFVTIKIPVLFYKWFTNEWLYRNHIDTKDGIIKYIISSEPINYIIGCGASTIYKLLLQRRTVCKCLLNATRIFHIYLIIPKHGGLCARSNTRYPVQWQFTY